ncbi:hypothetical protein BS78_04G116600 [Paspalum vaginatum]|nr:hypothetical protein BS78_04G116600 [Paspalum vaginatum]
MRRSRDGVPMQRSSGRSTSSSCEIDWIAEERGVLQRPSKHFEPEKPKRTAECLSYKTCNSTKKRNTWSQEENDILINMVGLHSSKKWSTIAHAIPGRSQNQCRERWTFYLDPAVNNQPWSEQEDMALIRAHHIYGNKWCEMANFFPGRTGKAIKNHWNGRMRRKTNSDLVRGLSEQFPCMPDDPFIIKNKGPSIIKSAQGSPINLQVSVDWLIKSEPEQGLTENGRNASPLKEKGSDSTHGEPSVAHSDNVSEKVDKQIDRSSLHVVTEEKMVLSSSSVDKVSFAAASFPTSLQNEESTNSLGAPFNGGKIGFSPAHDHVSIHDRSGDICSSADLESQELHLANIADLLDMPYCESLMIDRSTWFSK